MKKIFLIILVVALVVGGYFMFNNLSGTDAPQDNGIVSNWKTYKDNQIGYELQVPPNTKIGTILKSTTYFNVPDNATVEVAAFSKSDPEIKNWDSYKLSSESDVVIAGQKARMWVNQDSTMAGDPFTSYNIENDDFVYMITFRFTKNRELSSVEKQILSTFKFIK